MDDKQPVHMFYKINNKMFFFYFGLNVFKQGIKNRNSVLNRVGKDFCHKQGQDIRGQAGVYLGVRTWELFLCFTPFVFLGSFLCWLLCFTSPVSPTGSYTKDEPQATPPHQRIHRKLSCGMVRCNSKDDFYTAHELAYMIFTGLRIIGKIARWFCQANQIVPESYVMMTEVLR